MRLVVVLNMLSSLNKKIKNKDIMQNGDEALPKEFDYRTRLPHN